MTTPDIATLIAPEAMGAGELIQKLERHLATSRVVELYGAQGSLGPAIAARLASGASRAPAPLIYLVADEDTAEARAGDLAFFLPPAGATDDPVAPPGVVHLPAPDASPYAEMQPDRRTILRRMAALFRLSQGFAPSVMVASAAALFRRVMPRGPVRGAVSRCCVPEHDDRPRADRGAAAGAAGYTRAPVVEDAGTFAVRGCGDRRLSVRSTATRCVSSSSATRSSRFVFTTPARSARCGRSSDLHLHPVRETVRTPGADPRAKLLAAADAAVFPSSKTRLLLEQIEEGLPFFGIESLAPVFHALMAPISDYLPPNALFVVEEPEAVIDEARRHASKLRETAASRRVEHRLALDAGEFVLSEDEARAALDAARRVDLYAVELERGAGDRAAGEDDPPRLKLISESNATLRAELQRARADAPRDDPDAQPDLGKPLRDRLRSWIGDRQRVRLVAPNRTHADRLAAMLRAWGLSPEVWRGGGAELLAELEDATSKHGPLAILSGSLAHGFRLPADRLALVAEEEIFGARSHREAQAPSRAPALGDLGEIAEGDAVVHDEHGIGRYRGLKKLEVRGVVHDFLHLEYDGGTLYLPVYRIGLCTATSAPRARRSALDKLGGKTWREARAASRPRRARSPRSCCSSTRSARRCPATPSPRPTPIFREFEETFPFEETPDQAEGDRRRARRHAERPADGPPGLRRRRLRQDRGGAARGAAGGAGRQAGRGAGADHRARRAALRHLLGALHRLPGARGRAVALPHQGRAAEDHRRRSPRASSTSSSARTACSRTTCASRTSACSSIDEEQRFGVTHKERLKKLRTQVDVLTLTATPIPRTLQMAMAGLREISIIATPPADRLAIRTFVCTFDRDAAGRGIGAELARGGQVFFVHNRVEDIGRVGREAPRDLRRPARASRSATARWPTASSRR